MTPDDVEMKSPSTTIQARKRLDETEKETKGDEMGTKVGGKSASFDTAFAIPIQNLVCVADA